MRRRSPHTETWSWSRKVCGESRDNRCTTGLGPNRKRGTEWLYLPTDLTPPHGLIQASPPPPTPGQSCMGRKVDPPPHHSTSSKKIPSAPKPPKENVDLKISACGKTGRRGGGWSDPPPPPPSGLRRLGPPRLSGRPARRRPLAGRGSSVRTLRAPRCSASRTPCPPSTSGTSAETGGAQVTQMTQNHPNIDLVRVAGPAAGSVPQHTGGSLGFLGEASCAGTGYRQGAFRGG